MNLQECVDKYRKEGYPLANASAKVCQDMKLLKIASSDFNRSVTIKGGVVMHNLSRNLRRATQDKYNCGYLL